MLEHIWSTSSNESLIDFKFIKCIRDCYLFQHVNKPTRGRFNQDPHVLDLILTNEDGMVTDIEHYSSLGKRDHSILKFNFNCYFQQANTGKELNIIMIKQISTTCQRI